MRSVIISIYALLTILLSACMPRGPNPDDPYESINRRIYKFNRGLDQVLLKPPAKVYKAITPAPIRAGINNVYRNINLLPSIANDLLQADWRHTLQDTWRLIINTSIGIGGIFDPASTCQLPAHSNDLGLTFAKWGDKKSPYIIIPFLGPSTIRDGMGLLFDYTLFSPYPYIPNDDVIYGVLGLRYIDLRAQMLDTEKLMSDSLDEYSFMRDAYLQNRNYLITGTQATPDSVYVDDDNDNQKNLNLLTENPNTTPTSD